MRLLCTAPSLSPAASSWSSETTPSSASSATIRSLLVAALLEDALVHQPAEASAQHVAGYAQIRLEILEPADAKEDVAQDQQRPALADQLERPGDGAVLSFVIPPQHEGDFSHTELLHATYSAIVHCVMQRTHRGAVMDPAARSAPQSLTALLTDPRQLAQLGPTEEEVLADLMWPLERAE